MEVNLLKYVVPCMIQNRQLKIKGIVCSPPSYVVEALGRGAFKVHLSTHEYNHLNVIEERHI